MHLLLRIGTRRAITIFTVTMLSWTSVQGQVTLSRYDSIAVKLNSTDYFKNPWAGGLNSAQFSQIDLNGDGIKDLFIFEKGYDHQILTFINGGTANNVDYTYAPEYESKFPKGHNWMVLHDYNCDGREDIFNWTDGGPTSGMSIYRNDYDSISGLKFTLVSGSSEVWSPVVSTIRPSGISNLFLSFNDMPAIVDLDGDGDLDVLTFCLNCETIEYHRNYGMEDYGTCDSIRYVLENACWGDFTENFQGKITLGITCKTGQTGSGDSSAVHPGGSSMLAYDMDGDNDMDLLLSNINSSNFTIMTNGGDSSYATMSEYTFNFPDSISPTDLASFPAAYYLDVDNDGLKDLIAAPFTTGGGVRNFNSTWFYKNIATADSVVFEEQQWDFLQDGMIEVGEGANPVFFDHNADGLLDLVIGNYGYWGPGGIYDGKLSLYENIGSTSIPEFELITRDYAGLSALSLNGLYPAFGDLDGDGDQDLIIGDDDGNVHYFENTAGSGSTAVFALTQPVFKGIDVGQFATPQLVDVNRDGLLDLIIGERGGRIKYFANIGSISSPDFDPIATNDFFGGIDIMPDCCTGYNVPFLTPIDTSGDYYLFVAGEDGWIYLYGNIDNNLTGTFGLADSAVGGIDLGLRTSISGADLNGDGSLELVIGNYRGGVSIYTLEGSAVIGLREITLKNTGVTVFPNPNSGLFEIAPIETSSYIVAYVIRDILGRQIKSASGLRSHTVALDLSNYSKGLYLINIELDNGQWQIAKAVLR